MKTLLILLPLGLVVNIYGVATKNGTALCISVLIFAMYYAGKAVIKSRQPPTNDL